MQILAGKILQDHLIISLGLQRDHEILLGLIATSSVLAQDFTQPQALITPFLDHHVGIIIQPDATMSLLGAAQVIIVTVLITSF